MRRGLYFHIDRITGPSSQPLPVFVKQLPLPSLLAQAATTCTNTKKILPHSRESGAKERLAGMAPLGKETDEIRTHTFCNQLIGRHPLSAYPSSGYQPSAHLQTLQNAYRRALIQLKVQCDISGT